MAPYESKGTIRPRERTIVALTYLLSVIPLFGILIAAIVIFAWQERSRTVVFHATQAIALQAFFLLVCVVVCLFHLFGLLVGVLSPLAKTIILTLNAIVLYLLFIPYVGCCFYLAWRSLDGHDIELPAVGARLRGRSE